MEDREARKRGWRGKERRKRRKGEEEGERERGKIRGVHSREMGSNIVATTENMTDLDYLRSKVVTELTPASDDDSEMASDDGAPSESTDSGDEESESNKEEAPTNQSLNKFSSTLFTLRMRGLPFKSKREDVETFFHPLALADVRFTVDKDGRPSGRAYVDFNSEEDMNEALKRNGDCIGKRYIELFRDEGPQSFRREVESEKKREFGGRGNEEEEEEDETIADSGRLFLRNLSFTVKEDDLMETFEQFGPLTEVTVPLDKTTNRPTGLGFVTFMLPEHAVRAYEALDGQVYQGRLLHILPGRQRRGRHQAREEIEESKSGSSFKKKKEREQKSQSGSGHNWNALFLGANSVVDAMSRRYSTPKSSILDPESESSAAVRMALGETQLVSETREFLEAEGVQLDVFEKKNPKRSSTVILVKNLPHARNFALFLHFSVFKSMSTPLTPTSATPVSYTSDELHDSLVKWLHSCLSLGGTQCTFDGTSLSDGVIISRCLSQLAPATFTAEWSEKIIYVTGGHWKLRLNNLKKINKGILDYYDNVLHLSLDSFSHPDLSRIANEGSKADMARLLQLVLGIAINCERKETYIQDIMAMQEDSQHVIMAAIQELISTQSPKMIMGEAYKELEEQHKHTLLKLQEIQVEKEQLLQSSHDVVAQLQAAQHEGEELGAELERVREELVAAKSSAGVTGAAKLQQVMRQLEAVKSDNIRLETERDELKHRVQELDSQTTDLLQKNRELQVENEEISVLRDSLEEMKYMESKVKSYESMIHQYKKKIEDVQEMKKQLKAMNDKNMTYMQQNLDLEEELRRLSGLRSQIDMQKERQQQLENELAQEKLRCLEVTQDAEDTHQVLDAVRVELAQLKREKEMQIPGTPTALAPSLAGWNMEPPTPGSLDNPDLGSTLNEVFTPEMREKMVRLEKENEILRRRLAEGGPSPVEVGGGGGVRTGVRGGGEGEESLSRGRGGGGGEQMVAVLRKQLQEKEKKISQLQAAAQENKSQQKHAVEEIQSLKSQLKDKDKHIERIERDYMTDRLSWEREEKLVVSAWYEMVGSIPRSDFWDRTPHFSVIREPLSIGNLSQSTPPSPASQPPPPPPLPRSHELKIKLFKLFTGGTHYSLAVGLQALAKATGGGDERCSPEYPSNVNVLLDSSTAPWIAHGNGYD
ncbi:Probable RNA-binding protein 19 [Geodia barretti]|uniref:Probable RNA-binding protein 19 n=1 Tax=Geodia barretti TaxID=519541 RepID=A0AA35RZJ9_GEOBA|nr:Probable RNA-binding protein 19 [Geodia barretti]